MQLFDTLIEHLEKVGLRYEADQKKSRVRLGMGCQNGNFTVVISVDENSQRVTVSSLFPMNAPKDRQAAVAEYITRVNWKVILGNFEMDYSDGEIRYKTSVNFEGSTVTPDSFHHLLGSNFTTMDHYAKGLFAVIMGLKSAEDAIEETDRQRLGRITDMDESGANSSPMRSPKKGDDDAESRAKAELRRLLDEKRGRQSPPPGDDTGE